MRRSWTGRAYECSKTTAIASGRRARTRGEARELPSDERCQNAAIEARALADPEPVGTTHERRRDARLERVQVWTCLPADLEHVTRSRRS